MAHLMKFRLVYLIILPALCLFMACQSQATTEPQDSNELSPEFISELSLKVDSLLLSKMREEHLPGVSAVIVQNGKTLYKKGFGVANVETKQQVNVDTTI